MMRAAPICLAERIPRRPTAPSPTTATVEPGFTFAASVANQPVPMTSESVSRLGIKSSEGIFGVATRVPVREGDARQRRLCASNELAVLAGRLVSNLTGGTGVVGREKRTDHELTGLNGLHLASDLL